MRSSQTGLFKYLSMPSDIIDDIKGKHIWNSPVLWVWVFSGDSRRFFRGYEMGIRGFEIQCHFI